MRTLVWLIQRHCIWDSLSGTSSGTKGRTKNYLLIFKQMQEKSSSHLCLLFQSIHFGTLNPGLVLLLFRTYLELSRKWIWGSLGQVHQAQNIHICVTHILFLTRKDFIQWNIYRVHQLQKVVGSVATQMNNTMPLSSRPSLLMEEAKSHPIWKDISKS